MNKFHINNSVISIGKPVYIIAEMSGNHNRNINNAIRIIKAAKESGANAIKLQTYTPDTITLKSFDSKYVINNKKSLWYGKSLYKLYDSAHTPWKWLYKLQKIAKSYRLDFFSTAFDETAVDFLEKLNVTIHKVASFEIVDLPLIRKMAATKKPLIISTGMASLKEIQEAVDTARNAGVKEIALLKCTSAYPAPYEEMNLLTIPEMIKYFNLPVGLSDHSLGIEAPIVAISLGALIIEKHITLKRGKNIVDSGFSLLPEEFKKMVDSIRIAEKTLGKIQYGIKSNKESQAKELIFRPSLYIIKDILKGDRLTPDCLSTLRPNYGLAPRYYNQIIGKIAATNIKAGTPLRWRMLYKV